MRVADAEAAEHDAPHVRAPVAIRVAQVHNLIEVADEHAAFAWLDAPVSRVGGTDSPIPFAPTLEASWSAEPRVLPALRALLAF